MKDEGSVPRWIFETQRMLCKYLNASYSSLELQRLLCVLTKVNELLWIFEWFSRCVPTKKNPLPNQNDEMYKAQKSTEEHIITRMRDKSTCSAQRIVPFILWYSSFGHYEFSIIVWFASLGNCDECKRENIPLCVFILFDVFFCLFVILFLYVHSFE